jgi:hypothetical protein
MKEGVFIVYYEYQEPGGQKHWNGKTIQCDGLIELQYQLTECRNKGYQNTQFFNVVNGRPQNFEDYKALK